MRRSGFLTGVMKVLILGCVFLCVQGFGFAQTQPSPLYPENFTEAALQGFGDRANSQPWSMAWFNGKLYVGTGRATYCVQQATLELFQPQPDPYPPREQDVECTPDPQDLPLQAEIWRWTPETDTWERVYQSPNDVPILGTDKFTARDIGYRDMLVFTETRPEGAVQALYVSAVSSRAANGVGIDGPVPPPRILRTVDGVNFEPIPQDPGTFLGDTTVSGFRTLKAYKGRLYVIASLGYLGHGLIFESATPWEGNDSFRSVGPEGKTFFEIETYNGYLYAGTGGQPMNNAPPCELLKTDATGDPPYTFTTVIPEDGYRTKQPSVAVISLFPFKTRLYVGTDRELFRVNPDDTWDLVVGMPRNTPIGKLAPLSGMDSGFDNTFNIHMWRMGTQDGWLYVGTQDQSTKWRNIPFLGVKLQPRMGFDVFATSNGWHFTMITRNGLGDLFNNGARTFTATTSGLFLGAANHYYGLRIYRGVRNPAALAPPVRLEVESLLGIPVLTWEGALYATKFHVYRDNLFGNPVEIGVTDATLPTGRSYVDRTAGLLQQHHYYVVAENAQGMLSGASNMVRVPYEGTVPTFRSLEASMVAWNAPQSLLDALRAARTLLAHGDSAGALAQLAALGKMLVPPPAPLSAWRAEDIGVLLAKLSRRVVLVQSGVLPWWRVF